MHIYVGKLNWYHYAQNECITVVFPAGLSLNDPVCAYWQWTVNSAGEEKRNSTQNGFIASVTKTASEYRIRFLFGYYSFEGTVSADYESLSLAMSNPQGDKKPVSLSLQYGDAARIPSASIFTGKLDWYQYSRNEMVTVIIPNDVADGKPVILARQWTRNAEGTAKANHVINGTMRSVKDCLCGKFDTGYYTYEFTLRRAGSELVLDMTNPSGDRDSRAPYVLKQTDFRDLHKKKALILRFGTGVDNGIFLVQEMLTRHLGFAKDDVELLYFDVDPDKCLKRCASGQKPPTLANFKSKFTDLCKSAMSGDVRFVYLDAHNAAFPDETEVEPDNEDDGWLLAGTLPAENKEGELDEGWILAKNDDGSVKEVLKANWLADTIQDNLAEGVNLTILSSFCIGDGIQDTRILTPGILLAGSHEKQLNVKALNDMDPWVVGVTRVIKDYAHRNRGVPTYSALYNAAKSFIRAQIACGQLRTNDKYKGPSPNELQPIFRDASTTLNQSSQDPQLVFCSGYIDPDKERFLFPFDAPGGGRVCGEITRYPKDEYPHDEL